MTAPTATTARPNWGVHFIVPYYLPPWYLIDLVDGVRQQSLPHWRLTIVDDAYPSDAGQTYVESLSDTRITYLKNEANLGTNHNVARCMTLGELDFITVLGADDRPRPNYVATVLAAFEKHPHAVMVQPQVRVMDDQDRSIAPLADRVKWIASRTARQQGELEGREAVRLLMRGNWLYLPALCIRNSAVPRAHQLGTYGSIDDLAWVVDILLGGGTLVMDPVEAFNYRRRAESHSSRGAKGWTRFNEERVYFEATARRLRSADMPTAARMARLRPLSRLHALVAFGGAVRRRDLKTAWGLLGHVLT